MRDTGNKNARVLYTPDWGFILIPKNASTWIKKLILATRQSAHFDRATSFDEPPDTPLWAMWRDPKDRIESGYRFLGNQASPKMGFVDFVDQLCDLPDDCRNIHFRSQVGCSTWNTFRLNRIFFWDFPTLVEALGVKKKLPPPRNTSKKRHFDWPDWLLTKHKDAFSEDYRIWEYSYGHKYLDFTATGCP